MPPHITTPFTWIPSSRFAYVWQLEIKIYQVAEAAVYDGVGVKYRLLDLLACPICKTFPLPCYVFQENNYPDRKLSEEIPYCREYCGLNVEYVAKLPKEKLICPECIKKEVAEGLLKCPKCGRWYPIIDEIPHMLPDDLREEKEDLEFLRKWEAKIPKEVLAEGKPFHIIAKATR